MFPDRVQASPTALIPPRPVRGGPQHVRTLSGLYPERASLGKLPEAFTALRNTSSALSRLKCRVGKFRRIGDPAWHKEVCHAENLHSAPDGSRAHGTSKRCEETERDRSKGSACPDSAESRRRRSELERRAYRRGLFVPDENGGEASTAVGRAGF